MIICSHPSLSRCMYSATLYWLYVPPLTAKPSQNQLQYKYSPRLLLSLLGSSKGISFLTTRLDEETPSPLINASRPLFSDAKSSSKTPTLVTGLSWLRNESRKNVSSSIRSSVCVKIILTPAVTIDRYNKWSSFSVFVLGVICLILSLFDISTEEVARGCNSTPDLIIFSRGLEDFIRAFVHPSVHPSIHQFFRYTHVNSSLTDGPTERRMERASCTVACPRLKIRMRSSIL